MMENIGDINRREFDRVSAGFMVDYSIYNPEGIFVSRKTESGIMVDLSEGGTSFTTGRKLDLKTNLQIQFTLMGRDHDGKRQINLMNLKGEVTHNKEHSEGEYAVGIKFLDMPNRHKNAIASFVKGNIK
ncbi:MAG: PilZ domain-containing protein [Candidatus Aadella gelida]|nr:PilZ domain-containing protein [Candidatus Aadella gelida]